MRTNYTFEDWYTDTSYTAPFNFTTPIMDDTGVVAKWSEAYTYDVRFEENGGSAVADQQVPDGGTVIEPAPPIKEGYIFVAWYSDIGLTVPYNFATPVTADLTLYAKWKTYNTNEELCSFNHSYFSAKTHKQLREEVL